MGNMRIVGLALSVSMLGAGCVSDKSGLRGMAQESLAEAVIQTERPTVARMQQGTQPAPALPPQLQPAVPYAPPMPPTGTQPANFRPTGAVPTAAPAGPGPGAMRLTVRARVNGEPIFESDILNAIRPALYQYRDSPQKTADLFNVALDKFIDDEVIYQNAINMLKANNPRALDKLKEAARKEFEKKIRKIREERKWSEAEMTEQLQREGLTMDSWQRVEEKDYIRRQFLNSRIFPEIQKLLTPEVIREYYDQHRNDPDFKQDDKVKWQNIFIAVGAKHPTLAAARAFAETLIQRWQAGEDFSALLAFNDGPNRTGEGYGSVPKEIQPAELAQHLFTLLPGEIGPAVEFQTGVHIFRVVERDYAGLLPFNEEVQKTIRKKLSNEIAGREEKRLVQELRARAVIEKLQ
jgi:parvulin-like peptidyl-prolyl isomerase